MPEAGDDQPVRERLLLVLPAGNRYEYRCSIRGTPVGGKSDDGASELTEILRRT